MGHAVTRIAAFLAVLLMPPASFAQDKPAPKDSAAIEKCIRAKSKVGRNWLTETCIGVIANTCAKDDGTDREVIDCYDRELAVWDEMLNKSYQTLLKALDKEQQDQLRDMQRAWMESRDKTCEFLYHYFGGIMANPMIAACKSRATGRQALYLRGLADDVRDRK